MNRTKTFVVLLAVNTLLSGLLNSTALSDISADEIMAVFEKVAAALNVNVDKGGVTVGPVEPGSTMATCNMGITRKVSTDILTVILDAESGRVFFVRDESVRRQQVARAVAAKQAGNRLLPTRTASEILSKGREFSKLTGRVTGNEDVKLELISYESGRDPRKGWAGFSGEWELRWQRYINGYAFDDEERRIIIDDASGKLLALRNTLTGSTCPVEVEVDVGTARKNARFFLDGHAQQFVFGKGGRLDVQEVRDPYLHVIYPNYRHRENRNVSEREPPRGIPAPRLAYEVQFEAVCVEQNRRSRRPAISIWIDAKTGEVIGYID